MKGKLSYVIIAVIAIVLIFQLFIRLTGGSEGETAPDFSAQLIDGTDFQLSDLQGNYVVLDFWGSWCRPCLVENPHLVALHDKYKDQSFVDAEGFKVVTVALEKNDNSWQRMAERFGFSWKHQIVEDAAFVVMSPIANEYGVTNIPAKFLIGPDGTLLMTDQPFSDIDRLLQSKLHLSEHLIH
ncbi:MAG: TlpA disulfide reductase family protein [Bacteroidota bacterium]